MFTKKLPVHCSERKFRHKINMCNALNKNLQIYYQRNGKNKN